MINFLEIETKVPSIQKNIARAALVMIVDLLKNTHGIHTTMITKRGFFNTTYSIVAAARSEKEEEILQKAFDIIKQRYGK